jgi:hypothetical protein
MTHRFESLAHDAHGNAMLTICGDAQREGSLLGSKDLDLPIQ